jgi:PleD family two-component response regulator
LLSLLLIAEKIRERIEKDDFLSQLKNIKVTASFGLTAITTEDTVNSLLDSPGQALYKAKENGKTKFFAFEKKVFFFIQLT